jgi:hypothetical protein
LTKGAVSVLNQTQSDARYFRLDVANTTSGNVTINATLDADTIQRNGATIWGSDNDGSGSGLDADTVDGKDVGNSAGQIPLSNGTVCSTLNASKVNGFDETSLLKIAQGGSKQTITFTGGTIEIGTALSGPGVASGMQVNADFKATGTKTRIATGHDGNQGLMHAFETPLPMFAEPGRSALVDGAAVVSIPPDLANYLDLTDYHVFVTPEAPFVAYIDEMTPESFTVRCMSGDRSASFSWWIVARQGDMGHIERALPIGDAAQAIREGA